MPPNPPGRGTGAPKSPFFLTDVERAPTKLATAAPSASISTPDDA